MEDFLQNLEQFVRTLHPWIAVIVMVVILVGMQIRKDASPELLFVGGLMFLCLVGILTPDDALKGFANEGVLTIAGLLAVSAGLRYSGVLDWVGNHLLGGVEGELPALTRLAVAVTTASAFLLNTALVAMMMPVVLDWCRQKNNSPSRFLLPLSYFTILGGVCSLIGTSTNLVTQGNLKSSYDNGEKKVAVAKAEKKLSAAELTKQEKFVEELRPMGLFEIGYVGIPCALVGGAFIVFWGRHLLPQKTDIIEQLDDARREYLVEMLVQPDCPLIGKNIEEAELRQLKGLFLIEIDRAGDILTPVTPSDVIHSGDRLIFTGMVTTIIDLERIPGLIPAADQTYEFHPARKQQRQLIEAVISRSSPLVGKTIRDANFRDIYNAAVVAVHRNGARLERKVGDIVLEAGDTLLLQTRTDFVATYGNSLDFYMVRNVEGVEPRRYDKAWLAGGLTFFLILWLTSTTWLPEKGMWGALSSTAVASITIAIVMIILRCLPMSEARNSLDMQTLITVAASIGVGMALSKSGAAQNISGFVVSLVDNWVTAESVRPWVLLAAIYVLCAGLTEVLSNTAVAAMMFPFAVAMAQEGGLSPRPFVMAITLAASMSFMTPIGYQTNLMVMGPGGYESNDFLKIGFPLQLLMAVIAIPLIPLVWPFYL